MAAAACQPYHGRPVPRGEVRRSRLYFDSLTCRLRSLQFAWRFLLRSPGPVVLLFYHTWLFRYEPCPLHRTLLLCCALCVCVCACVLLHVQLHAGANGGRLLAGPRCPRGACLMQAAGAQGRPRRGGAFLGDWLRLLEAWRRAVKPRSSVSTSLTFHRVLLRRSTYHLPLLSCGCMLSSVLPTTLATPPAPDAAQGSSPAAGGGDLPDIHGLGPPHQHGQPQPPDAAALAALCRAPARQPWPHVWRTKQRGLGRRRSAPSVRTVPTRRNRSYPPPRVIRVFSTRAFR